MYLPRNFCLESTGFEGDIDSSDTGWAANNDLWSGGEMEATLEKVTQQVSTRETWAIWDTLKSLPKKVRWLLGLVFNI